MRLQAIDRTNLCARIIDQLVAAINSGEFKPGEALPAERDLAAQMSVSRSSVREAMRVLEHAGVVDVRSGSGVYVRQGFSSRGAGMRAYAVLLGDHSPFDILVGRRAVECICAQLAARERNPEHLGRLDEILDQHASAHAEGRDASEIDLSFHLQLAKASHNSVMVSLVERLIDLMLSGMWRTWHHAERVQPQVIAAFLDQHREIVEAIKLGDTDAAEAAMSRHLDFVESNLSATSTQHGATVISAKTELHGLS